jgi:hypothetical protein
MLKIDMQRDRISRDLKRDRGRKNGRMGRKNGGSSISGDHGITVYALCSMLLF